MDEIIEKVDYCPKCGFPRICDDDINFICRSDKSVINEHSDEIDADVLHYQVEKHYE